MPDGKRRRRPSEWGQCDILRTAGVCQLRSAIRGTCSPLRGPEYGLYHPKKRECERRLITQFLDWDDNGYPCAKVQIRLGTLTI